MEQIDGNTKADKKDEVGAIGLAYINAKKSKSDPKKHDTTSMIDASVIDKINVKSYSTEELDKRAEIIAQRKLAAKALIRKEEEISSTMDVIKSIPDWDLDSDLVGRWGYEAQLVKLRAMGGGLEMQQSKEVCRLIDGITQAKPIYPSGVMFWINEVVRAGRGRILSANEVEKCNSASGKWPDDAVVFDKKVCLVHMPSKIYVGGVSPTDKKIFYELKQLVSRYYREATKWFEKITLWATRILLS